MNAAQKKKYCKTLGRNLRSARLDSGFSLGDTCKKTKLSKGNMSKMENGGNPTIVSLELFCGAIGADLRNLLPKI